MVALERIEAPLLWHSLAPLQKTTTTLLLSAEDVEIFPPLIAFCCRIVRNLLLALCKYCRSGLLEG
jgi:hypothetical protein